MLFQFRKKNSNIQLENWIKECEDLGCGEFIITSVDNDGTKKGFDLKLVEKSMNTALRPLIISGELGKDYSYKGVNR